MEIPEKTLEAVKKVVFDIFDNGKVQRCKIANRLRFAGRGSNLRPVPRLPGRCGSLQRASHKNSK